MEQAKLHQRIKELDGWTDHYYEVVDHYYHQPNRLGRKEDESLRRSEPALNHMLNLFFYLAPQGLVDEAIGRLVGHSVSQMRPVRLPELDPNKVQPDMVFFDGRRVIFVEMKIESKSDVGQFVKYAIAVQHATVNRLASRFDLVMLVPEAKHEQVWRGTSSSPEGIRAEALRGLDGDDSVWGKGKNNAVRNYIQELGNQELENLREILQRLPLTLQEYSAIRESLQRYLEAEGESEPTQRLVEGMLRELRNRPDVKAGA